MTKTELLELLLVERHLPLPTTPKPGEIYDDPADQAARRADLEAAVDSFEKDPGRKRPSQDEPVKLVQRKGIWIADRSAA